MKDPRWKDDDDYVRNHEHCIECGNPFRPEELTKINKRPDIKFCKDCLKTSKMNEQIEELKEMILDVFQDDSYMFEDHEKKIVDIFIKLLRKDIDLKEWIEVKTTCFREQASKVEVLEELTEYLKLIN